MPLKSHIDGMVELERAFEALGKVPQSAATVSARAGARIALRAARDKAPVDTGALKRGIILKREKSRMRSSGKSVYDVMMSPHMNDIFQKKTATGMRRTSDGRMRKGGYYYPASMEYGFLTRDGNYIPGYHFLRDAIEDNEREIERKVLNEARKYVDKALAKGR